MEESLRCDWRMAHSFRSERQEEPLHCSIQEEHWVLGLLLRLSSRAWVEERLQQICQAEFVLAEPCWPVPLVQKSLAWNLVFIYCVLWLITLVLSKEELVGRGCSVQEEW